MAQYTAGGIQITTGDGERPNSVLCTTRLNQSQVWGRASLIYKAPRLVRSVTMGKTKEGVTPVPRGSEPKLSKVF